MSAGDTLPVLRTRIWLEQAAPDNPFAAQSAHCHGYDVYGDMLGRARWVDMLYLLFRGEAPTEAQAALLEALAVALANAGPRDAAVHAAMCAGVGGSTSAASLMAALAVGAGQAGGAREVHLAMQRWTQGSSAGTANRIWPECDHPPGFDPNGRGCTKLVLQALDALAAVSPGQTLRRLQSQRAVLEAEAGLPLALTGVAAAALVDLGFTPDQGEMLHLLLRLPGAAAHALEQQGIGHRQFPFFAVELEDDPACEVQR